MALLFSWTINQPIQSLVMPSFVSGPHMFINLRCTYYEHMMCIKNIWFAWTSYISTLPVGHYQSSWQYMGKTVLMRWSIQTMATYHDVQVTKEMVVHIHHMYTCIPLFHCNRWWMMRELLVEKFNNQPSLSVVTGQRVILFEPWSIEWLQWEYKALHNNIKYKYKLKVLNSSRVYKVI